MLRVATWCPPVMPQGGDRDPPVDGAEEEDNDNDNDIDPEGIHRQGHGSPLSSSADGFEGGDSPPSAPANSQARPRTAATAAGPSVVDAEGNGSVVPDLMNVYENLKRSSTPHDSNPSHPQPHQQHQQHQQPPTVSLDEQAEAALLADGDNDSPTSATDLVGASHQSGSGSAAPPPPNWPGYTIFDFSIPTIPSAAYAVMVEGATASATSADGQLHVHPAGRGAPPPPTQGSNIVTADAPRKPSSPPPPPPNPPKTTSSTASAASSSGRTLRKRPNHHSSSNNSRHDEQASVGSTSSGGGGDPPPARGGGDSSSGRHHSHSGGSNKRRKSAKDTDGRWSKRFTWPEDLHRDFVSAIFDVGLKHSSPSTIMEYMPPHDKINSERIKSHLQKYRLHRAKSREEFLTSYETSLKKMNESGLEHIQALAGGEVAAHLTYSALHAPDEDATDPNNPTSSSAGELRTDVPASGSAAASSSRRPSGGPIPSSSTTGSAPNPPKEGTLILPRLTEDEKQSALGTSMGYLMGLFFSLTQQLMAQRAAAAEALRAREAARAQAAAAAAAAAALQASNPPVAAVYDAASIDASSVTSAAAPGGGNATGAMSAAAAAAFAAATGGGGAAGAAAGPSTLSNLEENSMMKREMQSQMAFQNKMRALKQEELKKWRRANGGVGDGSGNPATSGTDHPYHAQHYEYTQQYSSSYPPDQHPQYATHTPQHHHHGVDPASQLQHHPHSGDHHHHAPSQHTFGDFAPEPSSHPQHHHPHDQQHSHSGEYHPHRQYAEGNSGGDANAQHSQQQQQPQQQQGANPRADRQRGLSFGAVTDDLWNAELGDDEQLFEFLLNN